MNLRLFVVGCVSMTAFTCVGAQKKKQILNDSNTPLHLLQPAYKVPYGVVDESDVKIVMDRVLHYLEECTPMRIVDKTTGKIISDYEDINANSQLERGTFRLTSYEWGVTYSAMLAAAESTGDKAYYDYAVSRMMFLAKVAPHFRRVLDKHGDTDVLMKQVLTPHALDDAGAVCAAMIKAQVKDGSLQLRPLIDNYIDYIMNREYRLADGTFARTRPQYNTLWLDDMFMGLPIAIVNNMSVVWDYLLGVESKIRPITIKYNLL